MSLERLKKSGTFDDIVEWFRDVHGLEMWFGRWVYGSVNGAPPSWDGELFLTCEGQDLTPVLAMFAGTNIEIAHSSNRWLHPPSAQSISRYTHQFRFVMLAEEWPSLLMMQELSRE